MKAVNYSELRANLKTNLDAVTDSQELLLVHRPKNRSIVMMSLNEYNSLQETLHLTKSKGNRERLDKAIENIKNKQHRPTIPKFRDGSSFQPLTKQAIVE